MKKFITLTLIFGVIFFIIDKAFYIFLTIAPELEVDKRLEKVINGKVNKDLIILGSSRGARNIVASQIEDSLQISSYNLSYPGSNIEFHEFLLRSIVRFNSPPKNILLVVDDPEELKHSESIRFRLDRLYPLAKYTYINDELKKRNEKSKLSDYFVLARINRKNFDIRKRRNTKLDSIMEDGSMPISFQKKGVNFEYENENAYIKSNELGNKLDAFKSLIQICTNNDINLHIIFPPNYRKPNNSFQNRLLKISNDKIFSFHYNANNPIYRDTSYYYDATHLKKNGAIFFTNEVIEYLRGNNYAR